jgi:hypothetical protein
MADYTCSCCGEVHAAWPDWHFAAPAAVGAVPPDEREARVDLTSDGCTIDGREFYAKGLLSLPVQGGGQPLTFGVWVSLAGPDFDAYAELFGREDRAAGAAFLGWLGNDVPGFEAEAPLAVRLHVREYPLRPWVEPAPDDHPLAAAYRTGVPRAEAVARVERLLHPPAGA